MDIYKTDKIDLDELYDKKRERDLKQMEVFEKILARIQKKIRITARTTMLQYCFFIVPEFLLGLPKYDVVECTEYLIDKLIENGFKIKYTHPNLLFISWHHYIPKYQRQEIKKKTGVELDGFGKEIEKKKSISFKNDDSEKEKEKSQFRSINNYKPSGKLIYDNELFDSFK